MTIQFDRPVGAAADLAELEYVSALHQTQPGLVRQDGSIRDVDIMHFIRSRYGIKVTLDDVRQTILVGLGGDFEGGDDEGGGDDNDDDDDDGEPEGIDLAEMVAVLLIPALLKSARREHGGGAAVVVQQPEAGGGRSFHDNENVTNDEEKEEAALAPTKSSTETGHSSATAQGSSVAGSGSYAGPRKSRGDFESDRAYVDYRKRRRLVRDLKPDKGLIRDVWCMILKDVTGSSKTPPRITPRLMRDLLVTYGEDELADDDAMLEDMARAASDDGRCDFFDADALARALTSDVLLYNPECEVRVTSNYEDVLAADPPVPPRGESGDGDGGAQNVTGDDNDDFIEDAGAREEAPKATNSPAAGADSSAEEKLKPVFCAPAIDLVADQYMSKPLVVLLWAGFVMLYFAYHSHIDSMFGQVKSVFFSDDIEVAITACEDIWLENENRAGAVLYKNCIYDWRDDVVTSKGLMNEWDCPDVNGGINYGCLILKSIVGWLYILALLMFLGLLYIGLGSVGNSVRSKRKWPLIIGFFVVGLLSLACFITFYNTSTEGEVFPFYFPTINATGGVEWYTEDLVFEAPQTNASDGMRYIISMVLSGMAMLIQLYLLLGATVKSCCCKGSEVSARIFAPGSVKAEALIKQAAARKINTLVKNARDVHGVIEEGKAEEGKMSYGQGLVNFSLLEDQVEKAGGLIWTWKRIYNGELFSVEGIWISARIWAGNLAQSLLSLFIVVFGISTTDYIVTEWRAGLTTTDYLETILGWLQVRMDRDELADTATAQILVTVQKFMDMLFGDTCIETMGLIISLNVTNSEGSPEEELDPTEVCGMLASGSASGILNAADMVKQVVSSARTVVNAAIRKLSESVYPEEEYMVKIPLIVGTAVACLAGISLSMIYIPSVISTTLKFRSGVIPFFHDKRNQRDLRSGMASTTLLLGSMFWGLLYSAALLGGIVGGIVFLFLWQATRRQVAILFATVTGLVITLTVKMLIVYLGMRGVFAGYYRKKPAQGNIVSLVLEIVNIGYTIATALGRAAKLIMITTLYIGRLDTPLLATGVSIGPLGDPYPNMFRKDILSHEAHRHPMLELLGTMYMLKIRYGEKFGNKAGYSFRLIFAVALMPWIRKYRVMARQESPETGIAETPGNQVSVRHSAIEMSLLSTGPKRLTGTSTQGMMQACQTSNESAEIEKLKAEVQRLREALARGEEEEFSS